MWHVQRVLDGVITVWVPNCVTKLTKNSKEKISFSQISEDKIFIAMVSEHCKAFNFTISFFLKVIKAVFMLCFNLLFLPISNGHLLCIIRLFILMYSNHF